MESSLQERRLGRGPRAGENIPAVKTRMLELLGHVKRGEAVHRVKAMVEITHNQVRKAVKATNKVKERKEEEQGRKSLSG